MGRFVSIGDALCVRKRREIFMNTKNKKGFTLVELVVVIAIIGVLAAILIPTMLSYVKKSRMRTANANAKVLFNTAKTSATGHVAEGMVAHDISVAGKPSDLADKAADDYEQKVYEDIAKVLAQNGAGTGMVAIYVDEDTYIGYAQWTASSKVTEGDIGEIIGQYPDPPTEVSESESIVFGTKYDPE